MKVERQNKFEPIYIILETQEEIDCIFALVNYNSIYELHTVYKDLHKKLTAYNSNGYITIHDKMIKKLKGQV